MIDDPQSAWARQRGVALGVPGFPPEPPELTVADGGVTRRAKPSAQWYCQVAFTATLDVDDVWPDGDWPEHPTAADVAARITDSTVSATDFVREWGLQLDIAEVDAVGLRW